MANNLNLEVVNGYWHLNNKPLNACCFAKRQLFSHYLRMKKLKQAIPINPNFKKRSEEIKEKHNHRFTFKNCGFDDFPKELITFEKL